MTGQTIKSIICHFSFADSKIKLKDWSNLRHVMMSKDNNVWTILSAPSPHFPVTATQ